MDKKRVGAFVGVAGVAGMIAAIQFVDINSSSAEYLTKNLTEKYNASLKAKEDVAPQEAADLAAAAESSQVVYNPAQKVQYVIHAPSVESSPKEKTASEKSNEEKEASAKSTPKAGEALKLDQVIQSITSNVSQPKALEEESAPEEEEVSFSEENAVSFVGRVLVDALNVRKSPSENAESVTVLFRNELVHGHMDGDWVAIENSFGVIGYAKSTYIDKMTESELASEEAERQASEEAERQASEEAERQASEEAERQASEEAERQASEEAERQASEEAERQASEEAERQASEEAERQASEEAERQASEEAERQASEEAERQASEEAEAEKQAAEEAEKEESEGTSRVGYVNVAANVRRAPWLTSEVITVFGVNRKVEGVELEDGWVRFELDGQEVYIWGELLSDEPLPEPEKDTTAIESTDAEGSYSTVADYVLAQVGKPYVFAASGPYAYDCSGLSMAAYAQLGIYLPHSAEAQSGYGYAVSMDELQPGDLLFYTTDGSGTVSHVTIYIGDGQMVHASTPESGVRIDSIYSSWYTSRFMGARRLTN